MPHDHPIQQLTHEHRPILQVVHGLSALDQALAAGRRPDLARLRDSVAFMREFADRCHHAKEEAIPLPAMEDRGVPHGGCPPEALRREHELGGGRVGALAAASDVLDGGDDTTPAALQQLYPTPIWKEDQMVFPMAERLFTPAELDALPARFERAEAELGQDHDRYMAFAEDVTALLGQAPARARAVPHTGR